VWSEQGRRTVHAPSTRMPMSRKRIQQPPQSGQQERSRAPSEESGCIETLPHLRGGRSRKCRLWTLPWISESKQRNLRIRVGPDQSIEKQLPNEGTGAQGEGSLDLHPRATKQTLQVSKPGCRPVIHSKEVTHWKPARVNNPSTSGVNKYRIT